MKKRAEIVSAFMHPRAFADVKSFAKRERRSISSAIEFLIAEGLRSSAKPWRAR